MVTELLRAAHRLDETIQRRIGRPFNMVLGFSLVADIVNRTRELVHVADSRSSMAGVALMIVIEAALLIHQLGELSERVDRKVEKRRV